jgi:cytochrome c
MTSRTLAVLAAGALFALSPVAHAAGDAAAGKTVFNKCKACHSDVAGKNGVGPSLFGVVGRPVASEAGYKYSDALTGLKASTPAWDAAALDKWLTKPAEMAKGTKMTFPGLPNQADRENVIAYLATLK